MPKVSDKRYTRHEERQRGSCTHPRQGANYRGASSYVHIKGVSDDGPISERSNKHEESEQCSFSGLGGHPKSHRATNLQHMLRGFSATCNSASK